jgi:amylosucrase
MTEVRRSLPHLHAATQSEVLPAVDAGIFAVLRVHPEGELLELFNVTEHYRTVPANVLQNRNFTEPYDALGDSPVDVDSSLRLPPYGAMWIVDGLTVTTRREGRPS